MTLTEQELASMSGAELFDYARGMGVSLNDTPTREQILFRLKRFAR